MTLYPTAKGRKEFSQRDFLHVCDEGVIVILKDIPG